MILGFKGSVGIGVDFMKKRVDDLVTVVPFTKAQMDLFAQEVSI